MNRLETLAQLHDAAALWSAGHAEPAIVVQAACEALADGADGHALAMLAAVSLRTAEDGDVVDLLGQALNEVGLSYYEPRCLAAQEAALAVMARRALW